MPKESGQRTYSEAEVNAIMRRVVELQSVSSGDQHDSEGITLDRLIQAASELGIDPNMIEQAALELPEGAAKKKRGAFGVSWDVEETVVAAGTVTPETWPQVLDELRDATGRVGYPSASGTGFEWLSHQPDPLHVTFTPVGSTVKVRVKAHLGGWAAVFYIVPSAITAVTVLVNMLNPPWVRPEVFVASLLGAITVPGLFGHIAFRRFCAKRRTAVRALLSRVKNTISTSNSVTVDKTVGTAAAADVTSPTDVRSPASYLEVSEDEQVVRQHL